MFTVYPNLYVVLVGPSGARKGTAMSPGMDLLNRLGVKLAAEAITREALIRVLKESSSTQVSQDGSKLYMHCSLTVFSQELTVFLGYNNMQLMADLCDWFDCRERWTYRTKNMGTDEIQGVWVNLFGATTPDLLQTTLPRDAIGGGLTARMILICEKGKGKLVSRPFLSEKDKALRELLLSDLERISMLSGEFKITDGFLEYWTKWYEYQSEHPPFDDERFSGYIERRGLHTLKLCMIVNASRSSSMIITRDDLERSIELLSFAESKMPWAFSGVGKSRTADTLNKVWTFIAMEKRVLLSEVMNRFYHDADFFTMNGILETLGKMGLIEQKPLADGDRRILYKGGTNDVSGQPYNGGDGDSSGETDNGECGDRGEGEEYPSGEYN